MAGDSHTRGRRPANGLIILGNGTKSFQAVVHRTRTGVTTDTDSRCTDSSTVSRRGLRLTGVLYPADVLSMRRSATRDCSTILGDALATRASRYSLLVLSDS